MKRLLAILTVVASTWTAASATDSNPPHKGASTQQATGRKVDDKKPDANATKPVCRICGGSCGLAAVCICEPGTKKRPKTTYSMKCEPVCVPTPRLLHGGHGHAPPCTGSPCDGRCAESMVRTKKSLLKTITDEEVDVFTRKIEYVCCHCSNTPRTSGCPSCTGSTPTLRRPWWHWLWPTDSH